MRAIDAHELENLLVQVVADEIRKAPSVTVWTSVKDELPDRDEPVLVSVEPGDGDPFVVIAWLRKDGTWNSSDDIFRAHYIDCITHWMPLPDTANEV